MRHFVKHFAGVPEPPASAEKIDAAVQKSCVGVGGRCCEVGVEEMSGFKGAQAEAVVEGCVERLAGGGGGRG